MRIPDASRAIPPVHADQADVLDKRVGTIDLVAVALWIALATGLTEAALLTVSRHVLGHFTRVSPQVVWQASIGYGLLFATLTFLVVVIGRGRASLRTVVFLCAWVGGTGVLFTYPRLHEAAAALLAAGVASQVAAFAATHEGVVRRIARRTVLPALFVLPVLFVATNLPPWLAERHALAALPGARAGAPNVLLIIWDTVRAASLSLYGYARPTTPVLARVAGEGVVFENAFSTAPWTTPSHASVFTGRYPFQTSVDWTTPLDTTPLTLAEVLADAGYRTAGFTANTFATGRESGLGRGFSHYEDFTYLTVGDLLASMSLVRSFLQRHEDWRHRVGVGRMPGTKRAPVVEREFLRWVDRDGSRPFFAFLNFFDAHGPYLPPAPYDTMYGPVLRGRDPQMFPGRQYAARELQAEIDAYDGSIRWLDDRLGHLLGELERRGALTNTIVVITSDHGEEFGEHGLFTHGHSLYDAVLRVPLVIRYPGSIPTGTRVSPFVSLRDVPTSILALAGLSTDRLPGTPLTRYWDTEARPATDSLMSSVDRVTGNPSSYPVSRSDMEAIFADPFKLIRGAAGEVQLFNLREDPQESRDLAQDEVWRATRDALLAALHQRRSRDH